ncbi:hypothetical protein AAC387_Pa06g0499 [Persea americana]
MQSGYGVPETQQFMMDGCSSSSLLSISQNITSSSQAPPKQHMQYHHLHQQQQQQRFFHNQHQYQHQIPITQPFFQQHHYPQFQTFLQQHERQLHQESGPDNSHGSRIVGGSGPSFIVTDLKFGVDDNSSLNDYNQVIKGKREDGCVEEQREEDSGIKEPFWKPLDIEYINRNNKRCKERMETPFEFCKKGEKGIEMEEGKSSGSNYGLFGELEAIYSVGGIGNGGNNQTGSGSALTGENPPATTAVLEPSGDRGGVDHASETSTGEEASLELQKSKTKKRRKQLGTIATFFERLVKQLMEQQESLHRRFLEVMENRDQERMIREEAWRQQETAKSYRDEKARAEEHALASSREAAIVAFLEKITGETINLPTKAQFQIPSQFHEESQGDEKAILATDLSNDNTNSNNVNSMNNNNISRRWPKAEVQALIRVRSSLETKFQEPGLKGPLWEQVSSSLASMGYQRSAKRCKEKWENINKYFRKTKDGAKKRSLQSKTCPYFHQLDQLYSKSHTSSPHSSSSFAAAAAIVESKDQSELLDAIVVQPENGNSQNPRLEFHQEPINMSRGFNFSEMGSLGLDFNRNGSGDGRRKEVGHDEDDNDEEEEEEDDDVEEDNEEHVRNLGVRREKGGDKHPQEHVVLFGLES